MHSGTCISLHLPTHALLAAPYHSLLHLHKMVVKQNKGSSEVSRRSTNAEVHGLLRNSCAPAAASYSKTALTAPALLTAIVICCLLAACVCQAHHRELVAAPQVVYDAGVADFDLQAAWAAC